MRRLPVTYRTEAQDDLRDIFRVVLLVSRNVPTARGFVQRIKDRCERIGDDPTVGVHATIWSPVYARCRSSTRP